MPLPLSTRHIFLPFPQVQRVCKRVVFANYAERFTHIVWRFPLLPAAAADDAEITGFLMCEVWRAYNASGTLQRRELEMVHFSRFHFDTSMSSSHFICTIAATYGEKSRFLEGAQPRLKVCFKEVAHTECAKVTSSWDDVTVA